MHGQIDGDSGGGKLEELSPFFTKLKDRLVLSNEKSLNLCFQHSLGERQSRLGCWCDPWEFGEGKTDSNGRCTRERGAFIQLREKEEKLPET